MLYYCPPSRSQCGPLFGSQSGPHFRPYLASYLEPHFRIHYRDITSNITLSLTLNHLRASLGTHFVPHFRLLFRPHFKPQFGPFFWTSIWTFLLDLNLDITLDFKPHFVPHTGPHFRHHFSHWGSCGQQQQQWHINRVSNINIMIEISVKSKETITKTTNKIIWWWGCGSSRVAQPKNRKSFQVFDEISQPSWICLHCTFTFVLYSTQKGQRLLN